MKNKKTFIIKIFMIIFIIGIIFSGINIITWFIENKNNQAIRENQQKYINAVEEDLETQNTLEYNIDYKGLKEINQDTVGYLKVNNTNIDYIVVKTVDNKYYLKHNFNKENNRSGWIFMDYRNNLDGNDKNIIIYGHNTRDGSMFGTLRKVITKEWYSDSSNHIVYLNLNGIDKKYQVFSTYSIPVEDYYIKTDFKDGNEFNGFINNLKKRSIYNYKVDVDENDNILTLSTCTGNGTKRMVLHAKEIG